MTKTETARNRDEAADHIRELETAIATIDHTLAHWTGRASADYPTGSHALETSSFVLRCELAKAEILQDTVGGKVPDTVETFAELHEHLDANCYGGLCDDYCPTYILDRANDLQSLLDDWLGNGRP